MTRQSFKRFLEDKTRAQTLRDFLKGDHLFKNFIEMSFLTEQEIPISSKCLEQMEEAIRRKFTGTIANIGSSPFAGKSKTSITIEIKIDDKISKTSDVRTQLVEDLCAIDNTIDKNGGMTRTVIQETLTHPLTVAGGLTLWLEDDLDLKTTIKNLTTEWIVCFGTNDYKGSILDFLKVNGLTSITDNRRESEKMKEPFEILTRHLKGDKDAAACRNELIKAGYKDYV